MTRHPPDPFRALAAATTPVVAAALLSVALLATGCEGLTPGPMAGGTPGAATAMPTARVANTPGAEAAAAPRLLVAAGLPGPPRVAAHDLAPGAGAGTPLTLPAGLGALAAIAVAPDGTLAVVAPDGRAWRSTGGGGAWRPLPRVAPPDGLPGPVLGASWAPRGDALLVAAGAPGSGERRTAVASLPVDGTAGRVVEIPYEADGPGLVALPDGGAALVVRDRADLGSLALVTAAGTATVLPVAARAVAEGGGTLAVADDAGVLVGRVDELLLGDLPSTRLPLVGPGSLGSMALASSGSAIAIVRLGGAGDAARVETFTRDGRGWAAGPVLPLDGRPGVPFLAWADAP